MSAQTQYETNCEARYQRQFDNDDAIAKKIDELIAGTYNPHDLDNAYEAMSECQIQKQEWERAMKDGEFLLAGEIVKTVSENYWLKRAEESAPALVDRDIESARKEHERCA